MIGVIGLGGAGCNIAHEAKERGFLTAAVNYSSKDLDAVDVDYKLKLLGSEGVGKDRAEALRLFHNQWEKVVNFIQERFSGVDAIIFAFSASGGSGSGISTILIDLISERMPDTVISAFVIVPDSSESPISQANTIEAFEDLSKLSIAIFPIDNQQAKNQQQLGRGKVYEYTNRKVIDLLEKVVGYTNKHSRNGNFDKKDCLSVMNVAGIAVIAETELANIDQSIELSSDWVAKCIQDSFNNSIFVPVEYEKVTRAALIYDGQEALLEYLDNEKVFSCFKNRMPVQLFEGGYGEKNGYVLTVLSGLSWCNKRLDEIEQSMKSVEDRILSTLNEVAPYRSKSSGLMSKIQNNSSNPSSNGKKSITDILSKYNR